MSESHIATLARTPSAETLRIKAILDEQDAWIAQHGSAHLKRCRAEGYAAKRIYQRERLAIDRPGWIYTNGWEKESSKPENPSEAAFVLLDEARKSVPDAQLRWMMLDGCDVGGACEGADWEHCPGYHEGWTGYFAVSEFLGEPIGFGIPAPRENFVRGPF